MARRKVINMDEPPQGRFLSNAEVKRLLDNARSLLDSAMFVTMLQNGVSLSGIHTLKYEDAAEGPRK